MPEGYLHAHRRSTRDMPSLWWIDPQKDAELRRALGDNSVKLPVGETDVRLLASEYDERATASQPPTSMTAYFVRRFLLIIPTFLGITLAVFVVMHSCPAGRSSGRSCGSRWRR